MAAGAAMQVVGWWTGYKIGGVISLVAAEFFNKEDLRITGKYLFYLWA